MELMEEALIKRVMPHSVEAEQSVIGAMLMDKDAILTASEIISGQDFYQSAYGVIFDSVEGEGGPAGDCKSGIHARYPEPHVNFGECQILCGNCLG